MKWGAITARTTRSAQSRSSRSGFGVASSHRWVATALSADASTSHLYLAVSNGADPTGTWIVRSWYSPGYLADFDGEIAEINEDQGKLKVLVSIFERQVPVELEFDKVKKL